MSRRRYCSIPSCENFRGVNDNRIAMYSTHCNPSVHEQWKKALEMIEPTLNIGPATIKVCMFHFNPNDIGPNRRLRPGAVPSIKANMIGQFWQGVTPIEKPLLVGGLQMESISSIKSEAMDGLVGPITTLPCDCCQNERNEGPNSSIGGIQFENDNMPTVPPPIGYAEALKRIRNLEEENRKLHAQLATMRNTILHRPVQDSSKGICKICSSKLTQQENTPHKPIPQSMIITNSLESLTPLTLFGASKLSKPPKTPRVRKRKPPIQRSFECHICKCQLEDRIAARNHSKRHVAARSSICMFCRERFTSKELLEWHICGTNGMEFQQIPCEYCDQSFQSLQACAQHLETAHADRTLYRCQKCPRYFGMMKLRDIHVKYFPHKGGLIQCESCSKVFEGRDILHRHMAKAHPLAAAATSQFLCTECGKRFFSHSNLRTHILFHSEPTIQCPECPAKYRTKPALKRHSLIHRNLKYKCFECSQTYSVRDTLEKHINRVHRKFTAEKRHQCSYCSFKFERLSELRRHMSTHTSDRQFECEFCTGRFFKYKGDLRKHLQTHVGDNIYKCDVCDQGFRYHTDMKRHMFDHYKEDKEKGVDATIG